MAHERANGTTERNEARVSDANACRVRVVARVRASTDDAGDGAFARANEDGVAIRRRHASGETSESVRFRMHGVGGDATQKEFFDVAGMAGMVEKTMAGYASAVFAYGQTGSGKTFTMLGGRDDARRAHSGERDSVDESVGVDVGVNHEDESDGVIARSLARVFDAVARDDGAEFIVRLSYYEIYKEKIIDLLARAPSSSSSSAKPLRVRWRKREGFYVPNLTCVTCRSAEDAMALVLEGASKRQVRAHKLNAQSSRSHAILTIHVERTSCASDAAEPRCTFGKMTFVDLAGSERLKSSGCDGDGASETSLINKSLFALGKVISTLADESRDHVASTHVPYRDSKLTKLLADSLGGKSLTLLIACCSPSEIHIEETVRTLQYASRAAAIVNTPEVFAREPSSRLDEHARAMEALRAENRALARRIAALEPSVGSIRQRQAASPTLAFSPAHAPARLKRHSNSVYHTSDVIRRVAKAESLLRSYAAENSRLERENDALRAERECLALERADAARDATALRDVVYALECVFVHGQNA